jgi:hypothetical protein
VQLALGSVALAPPRLEAEEAAALESEGRAPLVGGDRVKAHGRALDEALRQAVAQAAASLLAPEALARQQSELRLRILPRARQFVSAYRLVGSDEQGGMLVVRVSAQVALDRLSRELGGAAPRSAAVGGAGAARLCFEGSLLPIAEARAGTVTGATLPDGQLPGASFPPLPTPVEWAAALPEAQRAGERLLERLLATREVEAQRVGGATAPSSSAARAPGSGEAVGSCAALLRAPSDAPRSDAKAPALVARCAFGPAGTIRGPALVAVETRCTLRIADSTGRIAAEVEVPSEAYASTLTSAIEAAVDRSLRRGAEQLSEPLARLFPARSEGGAVRVQLDGWVRWAQLQTLRRALSMVPGVTSSDPVRLSAGLAELRVVTHLTSLALVEALGRGALASRMTAALGPTGGVRVEVRESPSTARDEEPPPEELPPPPTVSDGAGAR